MIPEYSYAWRALRNKNSDIKILVHSLLYRYGPLSKSELEEKLDLPKDKFELLWIGISSRFNVNRLSLASKKIADFMGKLRNGYLIYAPAQEIEIGLKVGDAILTSVNYSKLKSKLYPRVCQKLTTYFKEYVPEKTLAVIKLHYPYALNESNLTKRVTESVNVNLKFGFETALNYYKNWKSPEKIY